MRSASERFGSYMPQEEKEESTSFFLLFPTRGSFGGGRTRGTCTPSIVVSFLLLFTIFFSQSRVMRSSSSAAAPFVLLQTLSACVMPATKGASRLLYDVYLFVRFYNLLHSAIFSLSRSYRSFTHPLFLYS